MAIRLYKELLRELKRIYPKQSLQDVPLVSYIKNQFCSHDVTSQKVCKSDVAMEQLGYTYLCLLNSSRRLKELSELYRGRGERSIESAAELVGLKLPTQPKI